MNKIGDERMKGSLSLRGFRKLRTGAIVATGVFLIGLASVQTTVQASEEDGVWVARTVEQVKTDIQKEDNFFKYEIKWGDTLSVISEATNIPVDVLKEMNRISDRNLFLPHNELLYTEGESVTDSKTKHKIVIKESYGNKEVRTYEVVLQENHETAEVSFELKETTEKVQTSYTSVVCYGEVYNLVSDQVEGTTETLTPAQPADEKPATSGTTENPAPAPTKPVEEQPTASGVTETPTPAQPAEEKPATSGTTENPAPAPTKPVEEQPTAPGATETPVPAQPAEEQPTAPGATETPVPAQPVEEQPTAPGTTETPTPAQPVEEQPSTPGTTETPAPTKPAEEQPPAPGATETPAPTKPAEEQPTAPGATETPTPAQPAETKPAGSGTTETPAQPTEDTPADSNNQNNPTEPKDDVEKGLEENDSELESRKKMKLEEIDSSSLSSGEKEAAKLKVEEYTNKAKEAMKQAKTTDDQAAVVDNYSDDLITIATPGVDQGKPDYTNSGLSGNGPEGTHIGDNNAIGNGNSTPENTGFRSAPVYQPRVTRRERSVDEPKNKVSIYYNYDGMKDIPGFFNDLDSKNEVEVPQKAPAQTLKSILKSKIDQKKAELEKKGYKIADEYFVGIDQENATHYDYVVTFTKA